MKRWNLVFFAVGLTFLGLTVARVGLGEIAHGIAKLGWAFWVVVAINIVWYAADAVGWARVLAGRAESRRSLIRLVLAQIAGEAVNNATPFMNLGGEPMKGILVSEMAPPHRVVSSLVVYNTIKYLGTAAFIALGLGLSFVLLDLPTKVRVGLVAIAVVIGGGTLFLAWLQTRGLVGRLVGVAARLRLLRKNVERRREAARRVDETIAAFYATEKRRFFAAFGWHLTSRGIATLDAVIILYFMGVHVNAGEALCIQTVSVLLNLIFTFIPLAIGAAEGGHYFLFGALGLSTATGVIFSLIRRVRGIIWIGIGLTVALLISRRRQSERPPTADDAGPAAPPAPGADDAGPAAPPARGAGDASAPNGDVEPGAGAVAGGEAVAQPTPKGSR